MLKEGMTLAIEPMVNEGGYRVQVGDDGWTVRTVDGKPSAHFEHTIVVRKGEAEILTQSTLNHLDYGKAGSYQS
jgi:methionyl aminopeptidase